LVRINSKTNGPSLRSKLEIPRSLLRGASFINCWFGYSQVGGWFSTAKSDATHCMYTGCTFDHCDWAGAIFYHHVASVVNNCSFEYNDGVGLATFDATKNFAVRSSYIFNNCNGSGYSNESSLNFGVTIPNWTDVTASQQTHVTVDTCYITGIAANSGGLNAVRANIFAGFNMTNNTTSKDGDLAGADLLIEGVGALVSLSNNRNINNDGFLVYDRTDNGINQYQTVYINPASGIDTNSGSSPFDPVASIAKALQRGTKICTIDITGTTNIYAGTVIEADREITFSGIGTINKVVGVYNGIDVKGKVIINSAINLVDQYVAVAVNDITYFFKVIDGGTLVISKLGSIAWVASLDPTKRFLVLGHNDTAYLSQITVPATQCCIGADDGAVTLAVVSQNKTIASYGSVYNAAFVLGVV
jgi:hypothetical protein